MLLAVSPPFDVLPERSVDRTVCDHRNFQSFLDAPRREASTSRRRKKSSSEDFVDYCHVLQSFDGVEAGEIWE